MLETVSESSVVSAVTQQQTTDSSSKCQDSRHPCVFCELLLQILMPAVQKNLASTISIMTVLRNSYFSIVQRISFLARMLVSASHDADAENGSLPNCNY